MSTTIDFIKMVASGNDFCVIDNRKGAYGSARLAALARAMCDRKFGAGADGILAIEGSRTADARMRIFNADGSEAEMCGNGARCFSSYLAMLAGKREGRFCFETKAGRIDAVVGKESVRVRLTDPGAMVMDRAVDVGGRPVRVDSVNTGVPHAVIFVDGLAGIDVDMLGRIVRHHRVFSPAGTNVNFVQVTGPGKISIRTYERGVEGETLACGTGSCASALISNAKYGIGSSNVKVMTAGKEELTVYFRKVNGGYSDVWLEGKAKVVYTGAYNLSDVSRMRTRRG